MTDPLMPGATPMARIAPLAGEAMAEAVAAALEDLCPAVSTSEVPLDSGIWHVDAILYAAEDLPLVTARVAVVEGLLGQTLPGPVLDWLPARDWVRHVLDDLKPVRAGRFWVHGGHVTQPPPPNVTPLRIDAALAFGTGEHATTRGCLTLFDRLMAQGWVSRRRTRTVLDMGCGTGVLAIAAAKALGARALAVDIDADSVAAAREFARFNRVDHRVTVRWGNGFHDPVFLHPQGYGLIFANILARPLIAMAPALSRQVLPGGVVILAGLLRRQKRAILGAYGRQGLHWHAGIEWQGWSILALRRPGGPRA